MKKIILTTITLFTFGYSFSQTINTIAGNGTAGFSGDGGSAILAELNYPGGVAVDAAGNVYIGDLLNNRVRKVNTSGNITTFAGCIHQGYSGDGGAATSAELNYPCGVAVDDTGNVFIVDESNNVIRKVTLTGKIYTVIGNTYYGFSGDGGPAKLAELEHPTAITLDDSDNIYIADESNMRVRKVEAKTQIITTVAGNGTNGYNGDGFAATTAQMSDPAGVAVDAAGNIYIADEGNSRIRKVNRAGIISTFAGNGTKGFSGDGGLATSAELCNPAGVTVLNNIVYIADNTNNRIRQVDTAAGSNIITVVGNGVKGFAGDGGPALSAELYWPLDIAFDKSGNMYILDGDNFRIRAVAPIPTSTNDLSIANASIVYPNPSNGLFSIQSSVNSGQWSVEVYNMLGEKVFQQFNIHDPTIKINLQNSPAGIYLYRITNAEGSAIANGKLIIE